MSYGVDIWCTNSIHTGRLARGVTVVAQAVYRRQITPRGTLRGGEQEENYGIDLSGYVGAVGPETAAAALPGIIRGELLKDERVADVEVSIALAYDGPRAVLTITEVVTLHDEDASFTLVLAVSDVTSELLRIAA